MARLLSGVFLVFVYPLKPSTPGPLRASESTKKKGAFRFLSFSRPATLTMLVKAISHRAVFSL